MSGQQKEAHLHQVSLQQPPSLSAMDGSQTYLSLLINVL